MSVFSGDKKPASVQLTRGLSGVLPAACFCEPVWCEQEGIRSGRRIPTGESSSVPRRLANVVGQSLESGLAPLDERSDSQYAAEPVGNIGRHPGHVDGGLPMYQL
jgi:hypothetical protein